MLNKRTGAVLRKIRKSDVRLNFCPGTILLVTFCLMLIIAGTFSQVKITFNIPDAETASYLKFEYIPQIPAVLFTAALLGEFWGLFTVLLYIIAGLTPYFPVFGLGGGISYVFQYNFGYIFGFLIAAMLTSNKLKQKHSFGNLLFTVLIGVLSVHLIGIVYLSVISILRHDSLEFIGNLIYYQSLSKILYDFVFGFIAVVIARILRKFFWIILG